MGRPDVRSDRLFIPFVQPVVDALLRKGPEEGVHAEAFDTSGIYYSAHVASSRRPDRLDFAAPACLARDCTGSTASYLLPGGARGLDRPARNYLGGR